MRLRDLFLFRRTVLIRAGARSVIWRATPSPTTSRCRCAGSGASRAASRSWPATPGRTTSIRPTAPTNRCRLLRAARRIRIASNANAPTLASTIATASSPAILWNIPTPTEWRGPLAFIVKNWSFNGIVTYQSGFPFTVTQSGNTQNTGAATQRPDYVPGQNPELDNPDPSRWFNTDAFVRVTNKYGNVGRNTLRQPAMKVWDIGLFKEFPVTEAAAVPVPMGSVQPLEHAAVPRAERAVRHANVRPDHFDVAR